MNYETAAEIEVAVALYFNPRLNIIVPNVMWGLNLDFECDIAIATKAGYLNEVEIKVSMSDLRRDKTKDKWRYYNLVNRIRNLWYAVPERMRDCGADIPERAGLLAVTKTGFVHIIKRSKADTSARKLTDAERTHLAHLGAMRIWDCKRKIMQLEQRHNLTAEANS